MNVKKIMVSLLLFVLLSFSVFAQTTTTDGSEDSGLDVTPEQYTQLQRFQDQFRLGFNFVTGNVERRAEIRDMILERRQAHILQNPSDDAEVEKYVLDLANLKAEDASGDRFQNRVRALERVQNRLQQREVNTAGIDRALDNVAKFRNGNGGRNE